ncbi:MAG TPA: universal stress protein [Solirubrobacteraceae bacterium]|jgi:nucleotide-binding universal stress UspA family protein
MFNRIVVGIDARQGGRDALALAERLARAFNGELIAVHAYPYDYYVSRGASADFEAVMHTTAQETLSGELERAGVSADAIAISDSSPGRALHRIAERRDADLIVVGSAHRGRIGRVLAGDVTAGTLHGSPCAVLVAPAGYAEHGKKLATVGVGYDGSPESQAALELAHDLAKGIGARLRVIDVVVPVEPGGPFSAYHPDWTEHARVRREEAEERLEAVLAELGEIATGDIAFGDPARELAFEGNHLDLLITGSRGYGPVRRLMLGSTSAKLVHEAPCPVMVLTRSARHAHEDEESAAAAHAS